MKYIIELPDEFAEATKEYWDKTVGLQLETYTESDRKAIQNEVWELADYVIRMGAQERDLCFGFKFTTEVTANLSYQEAKDRFEAWLKQKDKIKVGDEVIDSYGVRGIITYVYNELCDVLWSDGSVNEERDEDELFKTGRHFPEIVELLEKMKEKNNESKILD